MSKRYVLGLLEESENIESFREQMINAIRGYSFTVARSHKCETITQLRSEVGRIETELNLILQASQLCNSIDEIRELLK